MSSDARPFLPGGIRSQPISDTNSNPSPRRLREVAQMVKHGPSSAKNGNNFKRFNTDGGAEDDDGYTSDSSSVLERHNNNSEDFEDFKMGFIDESNQ